MKAIVTGGAGFIGSHIVELLVKKKFQVVVIDNFATGRVDNLKKIKKKIKLVNTSIRVTKTLKNISKIAIMFFTWLH